MQLDEQSSQDSVTEVPKISSLKTPNKPHKERVKVTFLDDDSEEKEQRTKKLSKFSDQLARAIDDLRRANLASQSKEGIETDTKKQRTGCHTRQLERKRQEAKPHSSIEERLSLNRFWG